MTLAAIEEGARVFIDANVFIYHFAGASGQCTDLLARCEAGRVRGFTSALVVAEICHRLMTIEAVERKVVTSRNVVRKLAERTELVRQLFRYQAAVEAVPSMGIEIGPLTESIIMQGLRLQQRYGLLTNDSLILSAMLRNGIHILVSADRRFEAISEIDVAVPSDLRDSG
jgi:predicted nucleic acid-binding protein